MLEKIVVNSFFQWQEHFNQNSQRGGFEKGQIQQVRSVTFSAFFVDQGNRFPSE